MEEINVRRRFLQWIPLEVIGPGATGHLRQERLRGGITEDLQDVLVQERLSPLETQHQDTGVGHVVDDLEAVLLGKDLGIRPHLLPEVAKGTGGGADVRDLQRGVERIDRAPATVIRPSVAQRLCVFSKHSLFHDEIL